MKNYKQITYRYLKGQKNRTLLTLVGIILSVAMVSAIGTIIVSVRGSLITEAIKNHGYYHAKFENVNKDNIDKIINHVEVEEAGPSKNEGSAIVAETTEQEQETDTSIPPHRYIEIEGYEETASNMLPHRIKEGRFPKNSYEIAIEPGIVTYFENEVKIGDKLNLTIGDRIFTVNEDDGETEETFEKKTEREYTVVGFTQPKYSGYGNFETKGITTLDKNSPETGQYNVYLTVPDVKDANEKILSIAKDIGINEDNIITNYNLLRLSAESLDETFNKSLIALLAFVIILIMVSTIAVIYNAFNISVLERISQFGLLRSVGATPDQIRGIVLKEAFILSVIGIPIGLFSGVLAMKIVFYIISLLKFDSALFNSLEVIISPIVFLISTIVGLITVFLSAIGPARSAGKVSPLEAVRNTGSFKKESFDKIKKSGFIRKILGIEGEIAYKNLRRNRKRFWITVFSMVISISLFITFSTFSDFMFKIGVVESEDTGDFIIRGRKVEETQNIYKELKDIKDVNKVYKVRRMSGDALISEDKVSKKIVEIQPENFADKFANKENGLVKINDVNIYTIGDENFHELKGSLKEGNINKEELDMGNGVLVIKNTYAYNEKTKNNTLIEAYNIKPGDIIPYASYGSDIEGEETKYKEFKVMGVLDKGILDKSHNLNGAFNVITTEKVWDNLASKNRNNSHIELYIEMTKDGDLQPIRTYLSELEETMDGFYYIDFAELAREARMMGIVMSIFLYGFVAIITLISCINIINTISTNIILRTKEISMIKAVGMTQSGIKRMVALESLYYGLYAAVIGGVLGTGLTFILFKIVFQISEFQWAMPWKNIAIACIGATVVALLSGVYPLRRINDQIIVESMNAED